MVAHVHLIRKRHQREKKRPEMRLGSHSTTLNATLVARRVVAVCEYYYKQTLVE